MLTKRTRKWLPSNHSSMLKPTWTVHRAEKDQILGKYLIGYQFSHTINKHKVNNYLIFLQETCRKMTQYFTQHQKRDSLYVWVSEWVFVCMGGGQISACMRVQSVSRTPKLFMRSSSKLVGWYMALKPVNAELKMSYVKAQRSRVKLPKYWFYRYMPIFSK